MQVTGKLVEIFETAKIKETFQKREFVLEFVTNPKYPELIKFELVQDKCALLDDYRVGQEVAVDFDLRGRRWTDQKGTVKYFNTLQAWRLAATDTAASDESTKPAAAPDVDTTDYSAGKEEEMPF